MTTLVGLLAACAALCQVLAAGIRLSGRVVDENNAPVPGARVSLRPAGAESHSARRIVADARGAFSLELELPGEYLISAEREGFFRLAERPVRLERAEEEITLVLNHQQEIFERVTVSYSPPAVDAERTAPQQRITGTEIQAIPYPTSSNLRNAMRALPGVVQDNRGGLHLSGAPEEQTYYTLDGFQVNDPLSGRFETRISVDSVRSLEVSTGALSAEYGKGAAGALAIRTAAGDDRLRYSATNFIPGVENRKGLIIGGWSPRLGVSGPLRKGRAWFSESLDLHYIQHVVEDLPEGQDRTSSWRGSSLLRNQFNLTPTNQLFTGLLIHTWTAPRTGLTALDPWETTVDRRTRQWFVHAKNQAYLGRGLLLELGWAATRTFGREIPQGQESLHILPEGRRGNYFADALRRAGRDQYLANLFLPSFSFGGQHQLKLGLDLDRVWYWQNVRRTGYQHYRSDYTVLRAVRFGGSGRLARSNFEASTYLQDSWRLRRNLLVEAGLRHDWDRLLGSHDAAPRLGIAWSPPRLESAKLAAGFGIVYETASLRVFSRPLDQYSLTTYFARDGSVLRGPAVSLFEIPAGPLRRPRYYNWNFSWEQAFGPGWYLRANWLSRRGRQGLTYENILQAGRQVPCALSNAFADLPFDALFSLANLRRDLYDALELTLRHAFGQQYEWLVSYTRSRAFSNSVVDLSIDDPIIVSRNVGRMPWDTPNRFVSWGYLPLGRRNWALAYLLEARNGYPFSVQDDEGRLLGQVNERRFPFFFELNLHVERRFLLKGHRWALRAGFNNITDRRNYDTVNNNASSPNFLRFYGGQGRSMNFRVRWLGRN
ncbi:MAG: TonB-dependent receptor [Bryobacterales bacterium]|nr:TonB-dependent receptor [Bryobacteraceae bacterium]MDW8131084.1 TonB-dependent receptor [Bryobacterales bacterium]